MMRGQVQKHFLLFLLMALSSPAFNQLITGTVMDEETGETIPFATIYFGGTFVGTAADQEGNFSIDISEYASMPLKISAIGYYTCTLINPGGKEYSIVHLKPKVYEINEALVKTKSLTRQRKRNLKQFRFVFIGSTENAKNCVILNEEDIYFNYGTDRDTLKAYARKPLLIENRSLGYRVTYYLDNFEYYRQTGALSFTGEIIFNEDFYIEEQNILYLSNRNETYFGSRMHFLRALWANELEQNSYEVQDQNGISVEPDKLVFETDIGDKFLCYPEELIVGYRQSRFSEISLTKGQVFFGEDGFFEAYDIAWYGDMGKFRIADWLPYDYLKEFSGQKLTVPAVRGPG